MFKVLIVDDEIYVVALIKKLIQWEKYNMEVAATANDGLTALELVKEMKPDLVIVDVRMPGCDGISFMDKVREFNENVRFIVVSGHKQFDYARGAVRNNVEDYLLKPINREELESVVSQVCDKLMQSQHKENYIKEMKEELDSSKKRIGESLIRELFQSESIFLENEESLNQRFFTSFSPGNYQLMAVMLDAPTAFDVPEDRELLFGKIKSGFWEQLGSVCSELVDMTRENAAYYLLNYSLGREEQIRELLSGIVGRSQELVHKFEQVRLVVCTSSVCGRFADLRAGITEMQECMCARAAWSGCRVIEPEDIRRNGNLLPGIWSLKEDKLNQSLSDLSIEETSHCIREMFSKAFYAAEEDSLIYFKLFQALCDEMYRYFGNIGVMQEKREEFMRRMEQAFLMATGPRDYGKLLCKEVETLIEKNWLSGSGQGTPTIRIVKRYIAENYKDEISLTSVANVVNISTVYLSRLFKKEEGINFLDYVNQYRISVAKKLLHDVRYNVLEVADLAGFKNTRYFSKIFKKEVGITPSEYRKRHVGQEER